MEHSAWTLVLLTGALAALAWLLRQHGRGGLAGFSARAADGVAVPIRVLSSAGLGPQQRVVAVQVGEGAQAMCLLLGVTAQRIESLHVIQPAPATHALPALHACPPGCPLPAAQEQCP